MRAYSTILFILWLIYNCETWSDLAGKDYDILQASQINFLRRVLEISRGTLIEDLYLELGIWPIKYEIHKKKINFPHVDT